MHLVQVAGHFSRVNQYRFSQVSRKLQRKFRFEAAGFSRPHSLKQYKNGDDVFYVSDNLLMVADGFEHWNTNGIDARKYPNRMIWLLSRMYMKDPWKFLEDPEEMVEAAYDLNSEMGSATLAVCTIHPSSGVVKTYYIGDSIYGIFKEQEVEVVPQQMNSINRPYTLGKDNSQKPSDGYQEQYTLEQFGQANVLVLATDGVWDNLDLDRIHYCVRGPLSYQDNNPKSVQQIVDDVTKLAFLYSGKAEYPSPFYLKAKQAGVPCEMKGKPNDITAIVAKIVQSRQ